MYNNKLTGPVPDFVKHAPFLEQLLLQNNLLQDNLARIFNGSTYYKVLNTIDISGNGFTGDIPAVIFSYPLLKNVNIGKNCFKTFPLLNEMCNATNLEVLIVDGFNVNENYCPIYLYGDNVESRIPPCLFTMPKLQILHSSGIGMKVSFPDLSNVSSSMSTLSMVLYYYYYHYYYYHYYHYLLNRYIT